MGLEYKLDERVWSAWANNGRASKAKKTHKYQLSIKQVF